jgi:endonuclease YncB( thermonuclease family)
MAIIRPDRVLHRLAPPVPPQETQKPRARAVGYASCYNQVGRPPNSNPPAEFNHAIPCACFPRDHLLHLYSLGRTAKSRRGIQGPGKFGDMLQLMRDKETITIRLEGIDAPEKNQSFGDKAKAALAAMTSGKTVTIKKTSADKYGRIIGYVVADGVEVNAKLVEDGFAWHFKKYNDEKRFAELELQARQAKRGLWSEANPLPPWDYRALPKTPGASNPAATATDRK